MSNLSEAIDYLEDAAEFVDTEAEIDETNCNTLLEIADRIKQCIYDLQELAGKEEE